jgi:hypothetical protein
LKTGIVTAAAALCTQELFLSIVYIIYILIALLHIRKVNREGRGEGCRQSTQHIQRSQLGFTPPSWTSLRATRFSIRLGFSAQLFCDVTGKDDKAAFLFSAIQ